MDITSQFTTSESFHNWTATLCQDPTALGCHHWQTLCCQPGSKWPGSKSLSWAGFLGPLLEPVITGYVLYRETLKWVWHTGYLLGIDLSGRKTVGKRLDGRSWIEICTQRNLSQLCWELWNPCSPLALPHSDRKWPHLYLQWVSQCPWARWLTAVEVNLEEDNWGHLLTSFPIATQGIWVVHLCIQSSHHHYEIGKYRNRP